MNEAIDPRAYCLGVISDITLELMEEVYKHKGEDWIKEEYHRLMKAVSYLNSTVIDSTTYSREIEDIKSRETYTHSLLSKLKRENSILKRENTNLKAGI